MTRHTTPTRLWIAETGAVTLPSLFWIPVFFMILVMSVEVMVLNMRQVLLDRAMEVATRDLRLGNTTIPTHDALKAQMCTLIAFVPDCLSNLSVEVFPVDTATWSLTNPDAPRCTDATSEAVTTPVFDPSTGNQLVALRACLRLKPMTGIDPMALALHLDGTGRFALSSTTVFVNEPRNTGTSS
ncbi:MAG TPA: hypothetical protein VGC31_10960 [Paenirhodobacter sp.]